MEFQIGDILKGKVIKMIKIGVFVDIGNGKVGFVHISELSHDYIRLPSDMLKINDIVDVKIINMKDDKIGLSIKQVSSPSNNQYKAESFEDMMKKFKTSSEQKLSDLKKYTNNKQRRSKNKFI